ncbi:MAG: hypothetical protein AAGC74_07895, partial [Verrucomicrobiota bacterium]
RRSRISGPKSTASDPAMSSHAGPLPPPPNNQTITEINIMNPILITYTIYLCLAIPLTIWVARTLHKNGRIFLVDCFRGDEKMADSVNHLLVVGFYLINIGFVALYLKMNTLVTNAQGIFEAVAGKIGIVLLVLGAMHFFNIFLFTRARKRTEYNTAPPLPPTGHI